MQLKHLYRGVPVYHKLFQWGRGIVTDVITKKNKISKRRDRVEFKNRSDQKFEVFWYAEKRHTIEKVSDLRKTPKEGES